MDIIKPSRIETELNLNWVEENPKLAYTHLMEFIQKYGEDYDISVNVRDCYHTFVAVLKECNIQP